MPGSDPRSWPDQLVGLCFSLLIGAAALYLAVRLIEAVWVTLLVIGSLLLAASLSWLVIRRRRGGW